MFRQRGFEGGINPGSPSSTASRNCRSLVVGRCSSLPFVLSETLDPIKRKPTLHILSSR
ncbi:hypothetical protein CK203_056677 [Vitis vinifera]|uniref:Uncharacterized protein n=1 Tax=Vitis vinifera TaxID=29760 RepID=A0A438GE04_VITVI|nr:hypothetical protein CK203_056677 [Vitis vinifera]